MKRKNLYICLFISLLVSSCQRYLDLKPDQTWVIPNTVADLQAVLDDENKMTQSYPTIGEIASDYYYLTDQDLNRMKVDVRDNYLWKPDAQYLEDWVMSYSSIFQANVVLEEIGKVKLGLLREEDRRNVKGSALFFRAWSFFQLAQLYAPQYDHIESDAKLPGIPLRLTSNINALNNRNTLEETYEQIIQDYKSAINLLPIRGKKPTRPSKPAAFGALAKTFLVMGDYGQAFKYADSCLQLYDKIVDYNKIDEGSPLPFKEFNDEVIFHTNITGLAVALLPTSAKVATWLLNLYNKDDLRKKIYYGLNTNGTSFFKGSYTGTNNFLFNGIATDEVYLIYAESAIRLDNLTEGIHALNLLLKNRWDTEEFVPVSFIKKEEALAFVLEERERELAFTGGIYWSDRRRLNLDNRFKRDMVREFEGVEFRLPSNDSRYTLLIPDDVIFHSGMEQNPRK